MPPATAPSPGYGLLYRVGDFARRFGHVGLVAVRYGFGHIVEQLGLLSWLPRRRHKGDTIDGERAALSPAIRLRMALVDMGPTFVKLGQMLSARPDLLPDEYIQELRKLQDEVPPVSFDHVRGVIQREFGRPWEELFHSFEPVPAASASIGQVHYAQLQTGEAVAVKVQRPNIERDIETDLAVVHRLAVEGERRIEWCRRMGLVQLAQEFAQRLRAELNYTTEGHNTERLARNTSEHEGVRVPGVYWALTTSRVLTLERVDGLRVGDGVALREAGVRADECAKLLAHSMLRQVLVEGYFHADPHQGNVFVVPPTDVAFLDCGSVGWVGRERREDLAHLFASALAEDAAGVCDALVRTGATSPETDLQALRADIDGLLSRYHGTPDQEWHLGDILRELMRLLFHYQVKLPWETALMLKALILAEASCLTLDPEFDFREAAQPIAQELGTRLSSPREIAEDLLRLARELRRYLGALPRQVSQLLARTDAGHLKLRFEWDEIDRPLHRLDVIANRLSFSLVISAIILASALLLQSESRLTIGGFPLPGVVGLGIGSVMGLWLLYSILRSGRL